MIFFSLYFSPNGMFYMIYCWILTTLACSSIFHLVLIYSVFLYNLFHIIIFCLEYLCFYLWRPCPLLSCFLESWWDYAINVMVSSLKKLKDILCFFLHWANLGNVGLLFLIVWNILQFHLRVLPVRSFLFLLISWFVILTIYLVDIWVFLFMLFLCVSVWCIDFYNMVNFHIYGLIISTNLLQNLLSILFRSKGCVKKTYMTSNTGYLFFFSCSFPSSVLLVVY